MLIILNSAPQRLVDNGNFLSNSGLQKTDASSKISLTLVVQFNVGEISIGCAKIVIKKRKTVFMEGKRWIIIIYIHTSPKNAAYIMNRAHLIVYDEINTSIKRPSEADV